jgi:hypothetical protein
VRLPRPQRRQLPRRQLVVTQLHESIGVLLPAGAVITLRAVGLHDRLDRRLHLLPTHGIELEPAGDAAVGVLGHAEPPTLGRIRLHPIRVQRILEGLHRHPKTLVRALLRHRRPRLVERSHVDALLGSGSQLTWPDLLRHHVHLRRRHRPLGEPRRQRREVLQHLPRPHHLRRLGGRQPRVPNQPRPHRLQPVVLRRLGDLGVPDRAGQLGVQPVPRGHDHRRPIQRLTVAQRGEVLAGEAVQR